MPLQSAADDVIDVIVNNGSFFRALAADSDDFAEWYRNYEADSSFKSLDLDSIVAARGNAKFQRALNAVLYQ